MPESSSVPPPVTTNGPRLSTSSHSSVSAATNVLLNGLLPPHRYSQTLTNLQSNLTPHQLRALRKGSQQVKRSEKIKHFLLILSLTFILAALLIITIELTTRILQPEKQTSFAFLFSSFSNLTRNFSNRTQSNDKRKSTIENYFGSVWLFNTLLVCHCLLIHLILIRRRSRPGRTLSVFLRDFLRIFDNGKSSSSNTFVDYLIKTCLLCCLWYLSCYLMFRSMSILIPAEILILYSITVTLRQLLGWIFLHEQFIGNKIIAHILALSGLLFLAHDDGFRFNRFLAGLTIVSCAVGLRTTFDILINSFVKDLSSSKLTIVMINVCLCGTFLLWPLIFLLHWIRFEPLQFAHLFWYPTIITLTAALVFNLLLIVIPFKYISIASVASLLLVIPTTVLIDRYSFESSYSPLFISAIFCSLSGVLLSMIPKEWFQASETGKMKQALGLLNKESSTSPTATGAHSTNTTSGTSSAFEEIRAQRRIRNALLYNDGKS